MRLVEDEKRRRKKREEDGKGEWEEKRKDPGLAWFEREGEGGERVEESEKG